MDRILNLNVDQFVTALEPAADSLDLGIERVGVSFQDEPSTPSAPQLQTDGRVIKTSQQQDR